MVCLVVTLKHYSELGSISPTYLRAYCTRVVPKESVKLSVSFTLLGSARVKAVRRTLMKLSPDGHGFKSHGCCQRSGMLV